MVTVQDAIFTALSTDSALQALVSGIYDDVPQQAVFPYIEMGESNADYAGTKTEDIETILYEFHCWDRDTSHRSIKVIQDRVRQLLHNQRPTTSSGRIILMQEDFREVIKDSDGISIHGIQRFTILYQY